MDTLEEWKRDNRNVFLNLGLIAYGSLDELEKLQALISDNTRDLKERDGPKRTDYASDAEFHGAYESWERKPKLVYQTVATRRLYLVKKKEE